MSELRVLVLARKPDTYATPVRERFPDVELDVCTSYEELPEKLATHRPSVVLASKVGLPFPRELLFEAESVEWIQCTSAGVDHLLPLNQRVRVSSASGIHDEALADYIVCAMLMTNLHFPSFFRQQRAHEWLPKELESSKGQKLVVLGMGSIGSRAAAKARALGVEVVGVRSRPAENAIGIDQLGGALADADFLAVTLPRTPETLGLVGADVLRAMKPGSVLINISRGGIVDEEALVAALKDKSLACAVVDVFETEPLPEDSPLWDVENLVITPHTGDIAGWEAKVVELFCRNLDRWRSGETLENLVDPERGY